MSVLLTAVLTVTGNTHYSGRAVSNIVREFRAGSAAVAMRDCEGYADRLHGKGADIKEVDGKRVSYRETQVTGATSNTTETVTFCYEY